jgi:hypothetical protein
VEKYFASFQLSNSDNPRPGHVVFLVVVFSVVMNDVLAGGLGSGGRIVSREFMETMTRSRDVWYEAGRSRASGLDEIWSVTDPSLMGKKDLSWYRGARVYTD